jgi:hypothetical protein
MSTKKVEQVKKPVAVVKKEPAKKPAQKKTPVKKSFPVGEFEVTRFVWDKPGLLKREYKKVCLTTEEDIIKNPSRKKELLNEAMTKAFSHGWEFSDYSAIEAGLKEIEHDLALGTIAIEYENLKCRHSLAKRLRRLAESMRQIRWLKAKRQEIYREIDLDKGSMPEILPSLDDLDDWEVRDGKWQRIKPEIQIEKINLTKDQSNAIKAVLKTIVGEKLSNANKVTNTK